MCEGVGCFALVTAGCGAIVVDRGGGELTHLGVALAFGLASMVTIVAMGELGIGNTV